MDREISKEVQKKEQRKQFLKIGAVAGGLIVLVVVVISMLQTSLKRKDLNISTVDKGVIEVSVSASGKVIPAFEEIINSPINSRIVEVYKRGGDSVDVGTPILKLDLQSAETEYKKQLDEEQMKSLQLQQQRVVNHNKLSEMEMNLKVSRMELDRKAVELRNERYLDSLGAGTTDKVRQVELDYNVSLLKLKEDEQKYTNEQALTEADLKVKELELNIFRKSLAETKRTLDDAQIRSPRKAILTYVNNEIGSQIGQGAKVAIVSDLSHFKIEGEIADTYGDRIAAGSKAVIKIGSDKLDGTVSDVTPLSKNGVISFTVQLDEDNHKRLRSGLKTDVYVMNAVKDDVLRIANSSYYVGKGEYELFVVNGDQLLKRKVQLGDSNFEYVEVVSGLQEGDQVVVSDMNAYKDKNKLKLE
ncbi:efflux RND transporter periplasmic adaptor subunit [Parabacteroides acidifaciens]|uniref:Efflux RND transporter periplasmic adaptor subunit n=1 Tax=Parabacteroides acidifaciens TaxID=2290935 RepID=A0A3D8HI25_9BACT|nr:MULTISPECIES: efflux RND transporter periplasmic adaptor subunit [Parabacteroides]MBC8600627.1 efflux RND transporter periplasmic adaptor subunit [Parabacteroides acidifaciens]RDU50629.1 efflux RND transporter periplasmic adaptor subunit [Parabacteroides acidifaciens]RHO69186.1 efflux RND transporter periplasmic adaptor subunit [Parabacteroides sp. AF48-14]RHR59761.1 efflux RND transporter periplasmic adaptor subunit [Parabacteroides sp. AF17-28]